MDWGLNEKIARRDRTKQHIEKLEASGNTAGLKEMRHSSEGVLRDDSLRRRLEEVITRLDAKAKEATKPVGTSEQQATQVESFDGSPAEIEGRTATIDAQIKSKDAEIGEVVKTTEVEIRKVQTVETAETKQEALLRTIGEVREKLSSVSTELDSRHGSEVDGFPSGPKDKILEALSIVSKYETDHGDIHEGDIRETLRTSLDRIDEYEGMKYGTLFGGDRQDIIGSVKGDLAYLLRHKLSEAEAEAREMKTAETENGVPKDIENQEPLLIKDVKYVHIDDNGGVRQDVEGKLKDNLGMEGKLGEAASLESAVALIEGLVKRKERIDLIVLDQEFFYSDDENVPDPDSSRQFIKKFQALATAEENVESLGKTVIVMLSGTADTAFIKEMQTVSSRVVGLMSKTSPNISSSLKKILEDAGVVKSD